MNNSNSAQQMPTLEPGDWVSFGGGILPKDAVVCNCLTSAKVGVFDWR